METSKRQVTIIDELWDNEQANSNRRLYDEQERALKRQNIELNDRVKKFEKHIEVIKHDQPKDHSKELIKRALSKQAIEYNRLLAKKDEEIQQLNSRIKQFSKGNSLESALRQSNIEKLHLEKRLLSSSSSLNSTTTTNASPTTATSTTTTDEQRSFPRTSSSSGSSVGPISYQASPKANEVPKTDTNRSIYSNDDNATKLKLQRQQNDELQEAYKHLEMKYKQLLDIEERYNKQKSSYDSCLHENEQLKQKIDSLEQDLLSIKSTQNRHQDLQMTIDRLQAELQLSIKERDTISLLNTQLRTDITNTTNTNERVIDECEKLRIAIVAKSDECDIKQRENEQLKTKNFELESIIKSLRDTNDSQRRLSDENEINKRELKRKQDDFEQFQKMHDATKREHYATIQSLQEKIHHLERKTELQALKHEEILLEFESLKNRRERLLPSSTGNILSINNNPNLLPAMIDSQTLVRDDSAPIKSRQRSTNSNEKLAQVVVAKYSYEPLKFSPNDHPEIELPLTLGEYYLIYGDVDEDGFYDGRNLEGRYGLIPSNFIELITNPSDLPEHTKHMIQKLTGNIFPTNERISRHREQTSSLDSDVFTNNSPGPISTVRQPINSSSSDLSTDDLSYGKQVPYPTNLRIEKALSNSVLIAWNAPSSITQLLGYQVLLDHSLYTTIRANERTRALIENINLNEKPHRISIRTITQRGLSHDQECTLLVTNSKELSYTPSDLRIDRITQTSAVVSWWPASNDIIHKLIVNDIEVQTLKPGIYRFKLSGLTPNTMHKVTIKAKPSVAPSPQQQLTASIEFRTTAFDESTEPPKRVQVIAGPQANTILVSWEQTSSISTARGYRILIDGHRVQDITNPLNDHTVINLNSLRYGRYLTIRTLTDNGGESHDSMSIDLDDVLKKTSRPFATMPQELPTPTIPSPLSKSTIDDKKLNQSSLESPSMTSSMSTDVSQTELKPNSPRSTSRIQSPGKQRHNSDSNRIRTPLSDSLNINKSITSEEKRSSPKSPSKNLSLQSNNQLINKTNTSPRLFLALFDYDPNAMSPNQDSEEELPFKKGQIIKIFGDQDADGFYTGQTENGRTGYVPSNMVSEIETDDSGTESHVSTVSQAKRIPSLPTPTNPKPIKKMIAVFDYNPSENSPNKNSSDELSFRTGDLVYVHGNIHDDGFYSGELENGKKGLVPSNYLKEIISNENPVQKDPAEPIENKQTSTNVSNETKIDEKKTSELPPTAAPTLGFFDRLRNTFSWNSNQPI